MNRVVLMCVVMLAAVSGEGAAPEVVERGVRGRFIVPLEVASFDDHTLDIRLWEYDARKRQPTIEVDSLQIRPFGHLRGSETVVAFALGSELRPREDRGYYLTAFVVKHARRTHLGQPPGKVGRCEVLQTGPLTRVDLVARPVR